jgi:Rod binding domain-containing protein
VTPIGRVPPSPTGAARVPRPDELARLTKTSKQLEGLFVQQMFAAMRSTVPEGGALNGGSGEEMFTSMFDQQLADRLPQQWQHGIGEAIVARLKTRLAPADPTPAADPKNLPSITSPEHR